MAMNEAEKKFIEDMSEKHASLTDTITVCIHPDGHSYFVTFMKKGETIDKMRKMIFNDLGDVLEYVTMKAGGQAVTKHVEMDKPAEEPMTKNTIGFMAA